MTEQNKEEKELLGAQSATADATAGNVPQAQLSHVVVREVACARCAELEREVDLVLANTTTMATGWGVNDARWRSVFAELRSRVEALAVVVGSGNEAAKEHADSTRRSAAQKD